MSKPIIVKIESQSCVGYTDTATGYITHVENIGLDRLGRRWRYDTDEITTVYSQRGDGILQLGRPHNFVRLLEE